ncbi:MAG: DUF3293 domain-containing protein [Rhodanobacter sp.]|nr:MAG: DUF3293 domain-containing protein [Rhodanobacter sp.]
MDDATLRAFRSTCYLVCLDEVRWASIRIDQPLPPPLQAITGTLPWGFITAWNPHSQPHAEAENLARQQLLLTSLREAPAARVFPAIGVGMVDDWSEPSLFVIGIDTAELDMLGRRYRQDAYVHGRGGSVARLRLLAS